MKFVLRDLKIGDRLPGRIEELLPDQELLICFQGDLLRVYNETCRPFKAGDSVVLVVKAVSPLRFQLLQGRAFGHLDTMA